MQHPGAAAKDPLCLDIFDRCGSYLGQTLSLLIDILNPQRIILGGIYMRSADLLIPSMQRVLRAETLPHSLNACTILPAGLGETIGDYAALALAVTD